MTSRHTATSIISSCKSNVRSARAATFVTLVTICSVLACNRNDTDAERGSPSEQRTPSAVEPDNTKKNERDDRPGAVTAQDQGGSEQDREITQEVRQLVVKDDSLSSAAKNVKIVTIEGVVTLRGPVKSNEEKTTVASFAKNVAGVKRVDNELEVDFDK